MPRLMFTFVPQFPVLLRTHLPAIHPLRNPFVIRLASPTRHECQLDLHLFATVAAAESWSEYDLETLDVMICLRAASRLSSCAAFFYSGQSRELSLQKSPVKTLVRVSLLYSVFDVDNSEPDVVEVLEVSSTIRWMLNR
jgi:hypothetical protein